MEVTYKVDKEVFSMPHIVSFIESATRLMDTLSNSIESFDETFTTLDDLLEQELPEDPVQDIPEPPPLPREAIPQDIKVAVSSVVDGIKEMEGLPPVVGMVGTLFKSLVSTSSRDESISDAERFITALSGLGLGN